MKSYIVFSDIHGCRGSYNKLKPLINESTGCIFAGDGLEMVQDITSPQNEFYSVKGNCDYGASGESERLFEVDGVKIFLTHGHHYGVKSGLLRLVLRGKELGADVIIYGHTHHALIEEVDGILVINPGTCSNYSVNKTFAYLTISEGKASAFINDTTLMR